jgi:hypothetical protein
MPKSERAIVPREDGRSSKKLPALVEPMMMAHLVLTRDRAQHARWKAQLEAIRQADAVDAAPDPETRAILADRGAWQQMRATGQLGTLFGLSLSMFWMALLIPLYALGHGFGWLAASTFLLPIPLAWRFGRKLWEQASLAGMRDLGRSPGLQRRMKVGLRSMFRAFNAGFGFGFALVFLQTLITWFMTPAPTFAAELLADASDASVAGVIIGSMSAMLAPLVARGVPGTDDDERPALGAGSALARLDDD